VRERVAVVGDGLIGRSIRLARLRHDPSADIVSLDRGDRLDRLADATIIVLAAPVDAILSLLPALPELAPAARLVTDTGSTKRRIVQAARTAGIANFVAGHPMAGGTTTGPAAARETLFDDRPWFLLTAQASPDAVSLASGFVRELGAMPVPLDDDGEDHDRLVAAISHLPQVVASALLARVGEAVGPAGVKFAGAGLRDTTRLAASQASVWAPILATNAEAIAPLLKALARDLDACADGLTDARAIERLFDRAHRITFDP
jgi:prephenate dehydrogenase